jgi:hypothetical protein
MSNLFHVQSINQNESKLNEVDKDRNRTFGRSISQLFTFTFNSRVLINCFSAFAQFLMKQMEKKDEEPGEDAPLKPNDIDVEAGVGGVVIGVEGETKEQDNEKTAMTGEAGGKEIKEDEESKPNALAMLLEHPKAKLYLSVCGGITSFILLIIIIILIYIFNRGVSF